jgi:predicted RND superfamily exporter protein
MGWFGIPLDMVTVPMGCLVLGIIVDDTIHFLYWYRKSGSVDSAFNEAGPGAIFTSVIYILGFSLFLFSSVNPVRYFGILFITSIATALFADIVIMPIILKRGK